jgi:cation transport ATPase
MFDKTGTLTQGKPEVTDIISFSSLQEDEILEIVTSLEKGSEHSLADAIIRYAESHKTKIHTTKNFEAIPGKGICGEIDGKKYYLGTRRLLEEK